MELKLQQPSWQQEERIGLKMARSKNGTRDGESQSYDFITRVIESNWVWIIEFFDYMKCLLHPFCVACKYDRVPTDYSSLNNFVKHCFLLNANYFQPVASGPIWTYWPTGTIHLNFHLFFNIYFGTTPGENHLLCLFTTLQFTKICAGAVSNNASLHMRKQRQRIEVTSYPGYTISRSWSPAQGFWFSRACSFVNSCVRWLKGLRRHGECPDFMNKRLYSLDPTFSSYSFITCPRSSNLLCGVADTQHASRSGRNTKATLGLLKLLPSQTWGKLFCSPSHVILFLHPCAQSPFLLLFLLFSSTDLIILPVFVRVLGRKQQKPF